MKIIENMTFDAERSLYGSDGVTVRGCRFAGPADGESALKESRNVVISNCDFDLRYPFWHDVNVLADNIYLSELCRAAIWYTDGMEIHNSRLHGIKAVRECKNVTLEGCDIISPEFGWKTSDVKIKNTSLSGEYVFMQCSYMDIDNLNLKGKYSFQYVENAVIRNSVLDTKDAFWHAKNVTVYDSVIKGEYLAWYSENLRLVRCKIIGTQPLCYCKGLVLEDCTTEDCDLAFELSEVEATVKGNIISIYNPLSGHVTVDSVGEIINDKYAPKNGSCTVTVLLQ
jgi:hypothetical protein